jgi:hypothetical protein
MVGGLGLAVVRSMLLGLAGVVILVVTGILFASRPPRAKN